INGYDIESKTPITRVSPTPISRQDLSTDFVAKVDTAPNVTIDGDKSVTLYVDDPLELTCKVHAYPEPEIIWEDKNLGVVIPSETNIVEVPYDYVNILKVDRVEKNTTYQCKAKNSIGDEVQGVEIIAKRRFYFNVIDSPKDIRIKYAKEAELVCKIDAYPSATISWYKDAKPLSSSSRIEISKDNSVVTLKDMQPGMEGKYMCEANNDIERKVFYSNVEIFGVEKPVIDKSVDEIRITEKNNGELSCRILKGIPKPTITWSFRGLGKKRKLKETGETIHLKNAKRHKSGVYTCRAENVLGTDNHEIEVIVELWGGATKGKFLELERAQRALLKLMLFKPLRFPTSYLVTGRANQPNTNITLFKRIKTTLADTGYYACHAENKLGTDEIKVFLQVYAPPSIQRVYPSKIFEPVDGDLLLKIQCKATGRPTPTITWQKHDTDYYGMEDDGTLIIYNIDRASQGTYLCLAENYIGKDSEYYNVVVKDILSIVPSKTLYVQEGKSINIKCDIPHGALDHLRWFKSVTWTHDGVIKNVTTMYYALGVDLGATGIYECEVSNQYGSIRRSFNVTSRDCLLDIKKSFVGKHPIMFSTSSGWSVFPITDNYMIIPHKSHFYMRCPSGFVNPELFLNSNIMPYCERDDIVKIAGNFYKFGDLKCNKEAKPNFENTEEQCFGDNTEYVKLGFRPSSSNNYVVEVYRVCFDKVNDVPLFTMHQLSPHHTDIPSTSPWYSSSDTSTEDFEELYNCRRQLYDVSMALGRGLRSASCCFGKRHLVNPRDLLPGIPVTVSFEYKNIVPHWSTCNSKNWDDLEILVRKLVKKAGRDLVVFTGTSNVHRGKFSVDININNGRGRNQTIPRYLWKVVQDRASDSSIAIVQVNIPELTREEARKHVLCTDICNNIDWIAGPEWNDVDRGYTYCCSMKEFEKAFGYTRPITSMKRVLFDASLIPDAFLVLT
ncbi:hypothetical protein HF086_001797, partial [Spodoptera exigua]